MKFTIVVFNWEGDGVTALYVNGKYHIHGDYYHNKIGDWIDGFLAGLKFAKQEFSQETWYVDAGDCKPIWELGRVPPKKWPNKYTKVAKLQEARNG
jgi:hypothetical protein